MLLSEFQDLIGRKANCEEYELANALYMHSDLNKKDFCKIWKKMHLDVRKFRNDYIE